MGNFRGSKFFLTGGFLAEAGGIDEETPGSLDQSTGGAVSTTGVRGVHSEA